VISPITGTGAADAELTMTTRHYRSPVGAENPARSLASCYAST
jgi:hypothetical protein